MMEKKQLNKKFWICLSISCPVFKHHEKKKYMCKMGSGALTAQKSEAEHHWGQQAQEPVLLA